MKTLKEKGYTLVEIIIVIAIMTIFILIILILMNPGERMAEARDSMRMSHTNYLNLALNAYYIDSNGSWGELEIKEELTEICNTSKEGTTANVCDLYEDLIDITAVIEEGSSTFPVDPQGGDHESGWGSGYYISKNPTVVCSNKAETKKIVVGVSSTYLPDNNPCR